MRRVEIRHQGFTFETHKSRGWMYKAGGRSFNNGKPQWRMLWSPIGTFGWYKVGRQ